MSPQQGRLVDYAVHLGATICSDGVMLIFAYKHLCAIKML